MKRICSRVAHISSRKGLEVGEGRSSLSRSRAERISPGALENLGLPEKTRNPLEKIPFLIENDP